MATSVVRGLIGLSVVASLVVCSRPTWADTGGLDTNMEYAVTYQVSYNQAKELTPVKIDDIVKINGRTFLVIYISGYSSRAYIDFDSVRSLLPAKR